MQDVYIHHFPNYGYLSIKLTDEQVKPILDEVREIETDFSKAEPANYGLAGNIKKEFRLIKSKQYAEQLIFPFLNDYDSHFYYTKSIKLLSDHLPVFLQETWVNFQSKGEFNPLHDHSGIYSFVLWLQIPYKIEDEMALDSGRQSGNPSAGHFEFQYNVSTGKIRPCLIPADKTFENTLIIFPASLTHCVYPFFSSDEYRISVSGNFSLKSSQQRN